jgi:hypothetical protein
VTDDCDRTGLRNDLERNRMEAVVMKRRASESEVRDGMRSNLNACVAHGGAA